MKRIYQLQKLLEFAIWGSAILVGVMLLVLLYGMISGDFSSIHFRGPSGEELGPLHLPEILLIVVISIGYVLFITALFQLKQLVSNFVRRLFFTDKTVRLTKQIGKLILVSSLLIYAPAYLYSLLVDTKIAIRFEAINPESFFFLLIMGLFFLTLGHIFREAKNLKDENELTV